MCTVQLLILRATKSQHGNCIDDAKVYSGHARRMRAEEFKPRGMSGWWRKRTRQVADELSFQPLTTTATVSLYS